MHRACVGVSVFLGWRGLLTRACAALFFSFFLGDTPVMSELRALNTCNNSQSLMSLGELFRCYMSARVWLVVDLDLLPHPSALYRGR